MRKPDDDTLGKESGQSEAAPEISLATEPGEIDVKSLELREEVVRINRVAKVVKGGRRFSFNALVIVGDGNGHVGVGFGKAKEVPESIAKAVDDGKKNLFRVRLVGRTISHSIIGRFSAARVMLKPAAEGTGIIAGPAVRAVLELAGVKDVLTKCIGTNNALNVVRATAAGLQQLRSLEQISQLRGKRPEQVVGKAFAERYFSRMRAPAEAKPVAGVVAQEAAPAAAEPEAQPAAEAIPQESQAVEAPPTEQPLQDTPANEQH